MTNDFLQFARPDYTIDLHEFRNPNEALEFMERELYQAYKNRSSFVRVVHGIGEGIMKDRVTEALQNNSMISDFVLEESGGSTMVKM
jgi:dsDNA-specific endonuclease/ATPase MutS2